MREINETYRALSILLSLQSKGRDTCFMNMSVKSYDDYRKIAFESRNDRCTCGLRKAKRNPICSACKGKMKKVSKYLAKNEDTGAYCQNGLCPTRFILFKRADMKAYKQLVFCSDLCLKEFKEGNL